MKGHHKGINFSSYFKRPKNAFYWGIDVVPIWERNVRGMFGTSSQEWGSNSSAGRGPPHTSGEEYWQAKRGRQRHCPSAPCCRKGPQRKRKCKAHWDHRRAAPDAKEWREAGTSPGTVAQTLPRDGCKRIASGQNKNKEAKNQKHAAMLYVNTNADANAVTRSIKLNQIR